MLNSFIKCPPPPPPPSPPPPPPPPPLIFIQFLSDFLLSRPRAECPLSCPAFLPCTAAARLSSPLHVPPLPCLSTVALPCRRQHRCTPPSSAVSPSFPCHTRQLPLLRAVEGPCSASYQRQHPCRKPELPSWFVPAEPIVTSPGSSIVSLRERVLAHPGLQLLTLRLRLQSYDTGSCPCFYFRGGSGF